MKHVWTNRQMFEKTLHPLQPLQPSHLSPHPKQATSTTVGAALDGPTTAMDSIMANGGMNGKMKWMKHV